MNLALAKLCVQASADAYAPNLSGPDIIRDEANDTVVLIREMDDRIIVAARGSASAKNFVTDAQAWRKPFLIGDDVTRVHAGFKNSAIKIWPELQRTIGVALLKNPRPIVFTGHSLGGALSVLFAVMAETTRIRTEAVYTFGQPRVGNILFADRCEKLFGDRHFRFEDCADIVCRMPLPGRYWHSGQDIFMPIEGGYQENPLFAWKFIQDAMEVWYLRKKDGVVADIDCALADHHIAKYLQKVNAL